MRCPIGIDTVLFLPQIFGLGRGIRLLGGAHLGFLGQKHRQQYSRDFRLLAKHLRVLLESNATGAKATKLEDQWLG